MSLNSNDIRSKSLPKGTVLAGQYKIDRKIATGGMGSIYRALDLELDGFTLAIKMLHKSFQLDNHYVQRFKREVDLCSLVSHPNIVKIFNLVTTSEHLFYTMEFIEGVSLEQEQICGGYSQKHLPRLIIEIADGLKAIHSKGISGHDTRIMTPLDTDLGFFFCA